MAFYEKQVAALGKIIDEKNLEIGQLQRRQVLTQQDLTRAVRENLHLYYHDREVHLYERFDAEKAGLVQEIKNLEY